MICSNHLQDGLTALMKASEKGHMEIVKVLLDGGAEVNKQNRVSGVIMHCVQSPVVNDEENPDGRAYALIMNMTHIPCAPPSLMSTFMLWSGEELGANIDHDVVRDTFHRK